MSALKIIRRVLAVIFFVGITLLFLDFTGAVHGYLGWMAKLQLLPALLSLNVVVVVAVVLLTLLFGRVYCSVICPLGVMQDCFSWMGGRFRKKRFHYTRAHNVLRYGVLALFVLLMLVGCVSLASLIAPYSAFGRIAGNLFQPLYCWGNNLMAFLAERLDSYAFYSVDVLCRGAASLAVAAVTFVMVGFLSFRYGRLWCNTVCPVGSFLGLFSRFSLFGSVIDVSKCNGCKSCANKCKASCINPDDHTIDYSRCVACFDCLTNCRQHAFRYSLRCKVKSFSKSSRCDASATQSSAGIDGSRRRFLATSAFFTALFAHGRLRAASAPVDGGLAIIEKKRPHVRNTPLKPFGSAGVKHFSAHCTACQLCVSECPSHILRPSSALDTLLQPDMSYSDGFCRPECTRCSQVCPTGAIAPLDAAAKSAISIGYAVVVPENCVARRDGTDCGACARHCPAGAIRMVRQGTVKVPSVDENRCIGCGACEYYCPSRPLGAIYVEGRQVHTSI